MGTVEQYRIFAVRIVHPTSGVKWDVYNIKATSPEEAMAKVRSMMHMEAIEMLWKVGDGQ